jgi:hypothetical protein
MRPKNHFPERLAGLMRKTNTPGQKKPGVLATDFYYSIGF